MTSYEEAISLIIKAQEAIIGPLAFDQVRTIPGVTILKDGSVNVIGEQKKSLELTVEKFSQFFGHASIEVCKEAILSVKNKIPPQELPEILK